MKLLSDFETMLVSGGAEASKSVGNFGNFGYPDATDFVWFSNSCSAWTPAPPPETLGDERAEAMMGAMDMAFSDPLFAAAAAYEMFVIIMGPHPDIP